MTSLVKSILRYFSLEVECTDHVLRDLVLANDFHLLLGQLDIEVLESELAVLLHAFNQFELGLTLQQLLEGREVVDPHLLGVQHSEELLEFVLLADFLQTLEHFLLLRMFLVLLAARQGQVQRERQDHAVQFTQVVDFAQFGSEQLGKLQGAAEVALVQKEVGQAEQKLQNVFGRHINGDVDEAGVLQEFGLENVRVGFEHDGDQIVERVCGDGVCKLLFDEGEDQGLGVALQLVVQQPLANVVKSVVIRELYDAPPLLEVPFVQLFVAERGQHGFKQEFGVGRDHSGLFVLQH
eukprot:CAMPEP_0116891276 /NCGR_PEP_ID=MMETSP0467-20121206/1727_1 /TAXON_ID=283647 /ORGANISM="Mesodinium pulex, Strain SPMC105" /LENGTH=293 /DNA_ID=CAMNT_0004559699 /DNA_START=219 /DNA_END=1102 /DNA_ORIENTATION=-